MIYVSPGKLKAPTTIVLILSNSCNLGYHFYNVSIANYGMLIILYRYSIGKIMRDLILFNLKNHPFLLAASDYSKILCRLV